MPTTAADNEGASTSEPASLPPITTTLAKLFLFQPSLFTQLTSLALSDCTGGADLLSVLQQIPRLEFLTIKVEEIQGCDLDYNGQQYPTRMARLPSLKKVYFEGMLRECSYLISNIGFPPTTDLELRTKCCSKENWKEHNVLFDDGIYQFFSNHPTRTASDNDIATRFIICDWGFFLTTEFYGEGIRWVLESGNPKWSNACSSAQALLGLQAVTKFGGFSKVEAVIVDIARGWHDANTYLDEKEECARHLRTILSSEDIEGLENILHVDGYFGARDFSWRQVFPGPYIEPVEA